MVRWVAESNRLTLISGARELTDTGGCDMIQPPFLDVPLVGRGQL
jgi:hypothetical protein